MTSKSKTKGNAFERDIAKHLTDTYGKTFVRIPTSGAYVGGKNQHRAATLDQHQIAAHKGDLQPPSGWRINIECKNYSAIAWHQIIKQSCKQLDTWIDQLEQVSAPGDVEIIFFKISRQGQYVCIKQNKFLDTTHSLQYRNYLIFDLDIFFKNNTDALRLICT